MSKRNDDPRFIGFREAGLGSDPMGYRSTPAEVKVREDVAKDGSKLTNASDDDWLRHRHARTMRGRQPGATNLARDRRLRAMRDWLRENPETSARDLMNWWNDSGLGERVSPATAKRDLAQIRDATNSAGSV